MTKANQSTFEFYRDSLFRYDLKAGLSVFLVALPLCLGIALASNAPLFAGLVAGIVAGIVVSLLSGSEVSVSGPAAGLTVIVAGAITDLGSYQGFLVAVILAGGIQLLLGWLKAGKLGNYFPESVIKGMLVAIGIVIILKQIPHALGDDGDYEGEFEFLQADHENTFTELVKSFLNFETGAVIISLSCLAILIFWEKAAASGYRFFKSLPASIFVVLLGVALNELFGLVMPAWYLGNSTFHMVNIPILSSETGSSQILQIPDISYLSNPKVYLVAGTIAIVASLESLLSLEAADAIDPQRRISSPNKELIAQGVGNIISGALGGLPVTSVIVRTSANVYSGARTRMSAFVHGLLLLVCSLGIPALLNRIPLSCLAAVLLMVGYKLAKVDIFKKMYQDGRNQFIPFIVTIFFVVFYDLLMGIFVGTAVGLLFVLYSNFQSVIRVIRDGNMVLIKFFKDVSFLNKPRLKEELSKLQSGDYVVVDGAKANFIDHDIYVILKEFKDSASRRGIEVDFKDIAAKKTRVNAKKATHLTESL